MRFGDHAKTRDIMDNEFEAIFAGKKTAKQGLDDAVKAKATNCCGNSKKRINERFTPFCRFANIGSGIYSNSLC